MAIITATTGSCTPADVGVTFSSFASTDQHSSFGGRVFPQPADYKATGDTFQGYNCRMSYMVYNPSTPDPRIKTIINDGEANYQEEFTNGDFSWQDSADTDQQVSSALITSYADNQPSPGPKMQKGIVKCSADGSNSNELIAIYADYLNSSAQDSGDIEPCGRHPQTAVANDWSPMDANESCSAWVMKQQLCTNSNRVLEETRGSQTVVLI